MNEPFEGFWNRLHSFVANVEVNDAMSEEEKCMILSVCNDKTEVKNLVKPDVIGALPSEEYELERLYDWVTSEKREPAQTKFTSGKTRDIAREIEYRLKGNDR